MMAIIDYGAGNLFSLSRSLDYLGIEAVVTRDAQTVRQADRIIVPGVGAYGDAMEALRASGMDGVITEQAGLGKPVMGICLGMQLLCQGSLEYGSHVGLGLLPGVVRPLSEALTQPVKVPHMGWNDLTPLAAHPLTAGLRGGEQVYYVHSFYLPRGAATVAQTHYGGADITGIAAQGNVCGCQFHPEKSGPAGLAMLAAFGAGKGVR